MLFGGKIVFNFQENPIENHDFVFFLGDLNYRVNLAYQTCLDLV